MQEFTEFDKCIGGGGIWTRRRGRTKSTERSSGLHDCWLRKRRESCVGEGSRLQSSTEVKSLKRHGNSEMYTFCRSQLLFMCCAGSMDWNPKPPDTLCATAHAKIDDLTRLAILKLNTPTL